MSERRTSRMAYAANMGLSRHDCDRCKSETLHRNGNCIHCKTLYVAPARRFSAKQPFRTGNTIKRARA